MAVTKYLIQNGNNIYTFAPNFFKIGQVPITKTIIDNYGSINLTNMTSTLNESAILLNKVGVLGTGNEFECALNSDVLNITSATLNN